MSNNYSVVAYLHNIRIFTLFCLLCLPCASSADIQHMVDQVCDDGAPEIKTEINQDDEFRVDDFTTAALDELPFQEIDLDEAEVDEDAFADLLADDEDSLFGECDDLPEPTFKEPSRAMAYARACGIKVVLFFVSLKEKIFGK